jgi:DNA polymerase-4
VTRTVLHADMDAFYASVEQRDDPALRGKPVLVGGASRRSVVAAASYEARRFGARSAMPMGEALRRCPDAIVVPPRMRRYAEVSDRVFDVFERFTPLVEPLSLDEAFLDVTASQSLFGDGEQIARAVKAQVREELELTVSVGVATSKFVAKIASDLEKPNGLVIAPAGHEARFLAKLPVSRMWGVGAKAEAQLRTAGIRTIGDLAQASVARLESLLGSFGPGARKLARGEDDRPVVPDREAKTIGAEETFEDDLTERADLEARLLDQAARVARRLGKAGLSGRVVAVKLKYSDFTLQSRRVSLPEPVSDTDSIYQTARAQLDRFELAGRRVRLTGVAVADLVAGTPRLLFEDPEVEKRRRVQRTVDAIVDRFGASGVTRATLLAGEPPKPRKR